MGSVLSVGGHWSAGYRIVGVIQIVLVTILVATLSLWRGRTGGADGESGGTKPLPLTQVVRIRGAKEVMIAFFCYCALEQTTALWAASYLALHRGIPAETAAFFASLFFIGITAGRGLNGFLTVKFSDTQLIRMGMVIIVLGIAAMLLPLGDVLSLAGLLLIGLGCAPIYPCIIHSTPNHFGAEKSQALIGVQMASAYLGTCLMPPLFGFAAEHITVALLPVYLLAILALMAFMHEQLLKKVEP